MSGTMRRWIRAAGMLLAMSMAATAGVLISEGRAAEAIPLHLCSLSALAAFALCVHPMQALLDFLWLMGMPGALLALLFPAPAVVRHQALLTASYVLTHALILVIPCLHFCSGFRPGRGKRGEALFVLLAAALAAEKTNRLLGTDFLFLSAPPAGTPLEIVFSWGRGPYLLFLFALMVLVIGAMDALSGKIFPPRQAGQE